jgi:membrane fusion protein, multidrug efflux system
MGGAVLSRVRILGGLLAALVVLQGCGASGKPGWGNNQEPAEVGVVTLVAKPVPLQITLPGRTQPFEISEVRPQVGGLIKARLFDEGANVSAGQPLYQIDPATYQAAYAQAQAALAIAQANLGSAQQKAQRFADLVKINAVSHQDFDDAEAGYKQATATVQQQAAAAQAARINLAYTRVVAPIGGRIGRSSVTQGALVTAGQPDALTTIQKLDPIYVDVTQSSSDLLALRRAVANGQLDQSGQLSAPVHLTLEDGSDYPVEGRLQFTEVTVDQNTGAVTLRAVFPNPSGILLPGMYVRASLSEGVAEAGLLVPQQAVTRDEKGEPTAMVVNAQNKAELRVLKTDRAVGDSWLVVSGVRAGDRVIVQGLQRVQPGDTVKPVPAGPQTTIDSGGGH